MSKDTEKCVRCRKRPYAFETVSGLRLCEECFYEYDQEQLREYREREYKKHLAEKERSKRRGAFRGFWCI